MTPLVETCDCSDAPRPFARLRYRDRAGFTLIELLVVIAIASILAAVAIPGFTDMIQRNRVSGEVNSFVGDLQYARAQAIKTGQWVTICTSSDGSTCLGTNTWNSGWIVFPDATGSGTLAAGVSPIRVRAPWTGGDSFSVISTPPRSTITYARTGFATGVAAGGVTLKVTTTPANPNAVRCVYLDLAGHQSVLTSGSGTCT
jgi:type IV fimbrial biogenesis protein FimT